MPDGEIVHLMIDTKMKICALVHCSVKNECLIP